MMTFQHNTNRIFFCAWIEKSITVIIESSPTVDLKIRLDLCPSLVVMMILIIVIGGTTSGAPL